MLLSYSTATATQTPRGQGYSETIGLRLDFQPPVLLQCGAVRAALLNHQDSTTWAEHLRTGHTKSWSVCTRSCPSSTERTALVASHLSDPVQSGDNIVKPRQQIPSVPQRLCGLCRQSTKTTRSAFSYQPKLHSSTNKNQIWRENLFYFWAHCLEQSACVCQIVANSGWLQTQPGVTFFNCAFDKF